MTATTRSRRRIVYIAVFIAAAASGEAQDHAKYQTDFPAEELAARRERVLDAIGDNAIAIIQGAATAAGFVVFRQSNELYYLTGLEVPQSYLLLDGRQRRALLFLPHRDERRERGEGKTFSAEDAERVTELTGVDAVYGNDYLARQLYGFALRPPFPTLYTFTSPAEGRAQSRDENLIGHAGVVSDPWDGRPSREGQFIHLLRTRYPQFEIADLTPILDAMRIVKSAREVELVRRASRIAGLGIMEAIRSSRPGVREYQLDAAARYIYFVNGSQGEGYRSITASGSNAYFGHYYRNDATLAAGDLVLMDYAPDYRYYTSDVARMWPVSGTFDAAQRALYGFIVEYSKALMKRIRPGVTADAILDGAAEEMKGVLDSIDFASEAHEQAAREALAFRGHLSHPVGLAVHDVGSYRSRPLVPGVVFSVDPMLWVHEERLYVRMEDTVVVTEDGVENFTDFMPSELDEIEALMKEEGLVQIRPPAIE
ncbi:MAG TPA: Xaa-Pro peptidase family protein [Vicinamibacteria bacterium]|nr:Xaa-Pro peptidase family protein [Vicinamibacteria bacterium]